MMFLKILILLILAGVSYIAWREYLGPWLGVRKFLGNPSNALPVFREIPTGYNHQQPDEHGTHAALDLIELTPNSELGKGIFVTGGKGQPNGLFVLDKASFRDVAAEFGVEGDKDETTYGALLADIDGDGVEELLLAQDSGVYIYERPDGESPFKLRRKLDEVEMPDRTVPLSIAAADTQGSGNLDLYISTFIGHEHSITANFNNQDVRSRNLFLLGNGDGTFTDATESAGLHFHQNTFMALFADLSGNGSPDLIVAPNTDKARCYENNGDGTFTEHDLPLGWGYWMGVAAADVTGDGKLDLLFSNVGRAVPAKLVKGDSRPDQPLDLNFRLLRNDGDFKFTDIAAEIGAKTTHFGWGVTFADFTGKGRKDFVVTENYTAFPLDLHSKIPTPGKLMLQGEDGHYIRAERAAGVTNPHFGYRALATDLTGNGYPDLVFANLKGPLRVFVNDGPK